MPPFRAFSCVSWFQHSRHFCVDGLFHTASSKGATDITAYQTVAREATGRLTVNHSIFVARAVEIVTETEVREFLGRVKATEPRADHHCYAYRLGPREREIVYASDAGEPGGSAGRPILQAIQAAGLTNVLVVVTRYFGGRKLGIPGLIEAYRASATDVLALAGTITRVPSCVLELRLGYDRLEPVRRLARVHAAQETATEFGQEVLLRLSVPLAEKESFLEGLAALGLRPGQMGSA